MRPGLNAGLLLKESETSDTTEAFYDRAQDKMNEIYQNAMDAALNDTSTPFDGKKFTEWIFDGCYYVYRTVADVAPYLIVFSILFGVLICACSRKNKGLRKWAIVWLIILIPVSLLVFRFGVGILIGIFG
ncbi:hypothetical protein QMP26_41210 (plasmid) [Enterocloster clostridioformis]